MSEERRKSVRIKKDLAVRYRYCLDKNEKKWDMTALIRDISDSGMSFNTHQKFSPNDVLTFLIKIPFRPFDWIELTGRVVVCEDLKNPYRATLTSTHITRVEFINLKEDEKQLIREYVTWFLGKERGGKK